MKNKIIKWALLFWLLTLVIFFTVRILPVSPAEMLLFSYGLPATEENIKNLEADWGLDRPYVEQYKQWAVHFLQGDWGISYMTKRPVRYELISRGKISAIIGMGALFVASLGAFVLGYQASLKENGLWDRLSKILALFCQTTPAFLLAIVIIYFLGVKLKMVKFFTGDGKISLWIAIGVVALYSLGPLSRVVRSHFREIMGQTYVFSAISRGFSPKYVLLHHGYKPVLYGLFSVLIPKFAWVIGGTAVIEIAFGIPGMSNFLVESIRYRDYNVIQSYILIIALWMIFIHGGLSMILNLIGEKGYSK